MDDGNAPLERTWDGLPVAGEPPFGATVVVLRRLPGRTEFLLLHRRHNGPTFQGDWAWGPPSGARWPGEAVDRSRRLVFRFDGKGHTGFEGDTVGSALAGALVGTVAAYLYAKAVDEERGSGGEVQPLQVGQLIAIGLAVLGIVRQITEMGRPSGGKRRR